MPLGGMFGPSGPFSTPGVSRYPEPVKQKTGDNDCDPFHDHNHDEP